MCKIDLEDLKAKFETAYIQGDQDSTTTITNQLQKLLQADIISEDDEWLKMALYLTYAYIKLDALPDLENWLNELTDSHSRFERIDKVDFVQQLCELGKKQYEENKLGATKLVLKKAEEILTHQIEQLGDKDDIYFSQFFNTVINISMTYVNIGYIESPIKWGQHIVRVLKESVHANSRINLAAIELLSLIYESTNRYSEATTLLCATLSDIASGIFKEIDFTIELVKILVRTLTTIGYNDAIESTLTNLIDIYRQHPLQSRNAMFLMLFELSGFYLKRGRPDLAEPLLNELTLEARETKDAEPTKFAELLAIRGRALVMLKRFEEAESPIREALEIRRNIQGEKSTDFALSLISLADIYNAVNRYSKAEEFVKQALLIFKEDRALESMIPGAIYTLTQALRPQEKYLEAEEVLQEAFSILRSYEDIPPTLEIGLHRELGFVYSRMNKIAKAAEEHLKALELFRKKLSVDSLGFLDILKEPIHYLQALGRHSDALPLLRELIAELEKQNSANNILCPWLLKLGISHFETGAIKESEEYLQKAIKIAEKELGRKSFEYISAANFLVEIYGSSDRLIEAEQQIQDLILSAKSLLQSDEPELLSVLAKQAIIFHRLGKEEEVIAVCQDIVFKTRSVKEQFIGQVAELLRNTAAVFIQEGQNEGALHLLLRVQELEINLLEANDPLRQKTNSTITSLQKNIYPPKGIEWNPKAPVGKEVEYEELKLISACLNAFWRRDYKLCIELAYIDFKDLRTGLLVILSHMYLKDTEKVKIWSDVFEKAWADSPLAILLLGVLIGNVRNADTRVDSEDYRNLCMIHYYSAERLLTQGIEDKAREHLSKAIDYANLGKEIILEGVMAQVSQQFLDDPTNGPTPTEIETQVEVLNSQRQKALDEGRTDDALKLAIEARDKAKKLGLEHPIYGQSLIDLAEQYDKHDNDTRADVLIEQGLDILSHCFRTNHPELNRGVKKVLFNITKHDNKKKLVYRATIVVNKTKDENGLLILIMGLKDLLDSEFYRDAISKALEATRNNPAHYAILRFGIGQISVESAIAECKTDRQRSLVHFFEARRLLNIGDIINACKHYDSVIEINTNGVEQNFAREERPLISNKPASTEPVNSSSLKYKIKKASEYLESNQLDEAFRIANEVEMSMERIEDDHNDSIELSAYLGWLYFQMGSLDQAIRVAEKAFVICPKSNQHYSVLAEIIGTIYQVKTDTTNAEKYLQEAYLAVKEESKNTSRYAKLLLKIADLQIEKSNYSIAEQLVKELMDVSEVVWGMDNTHYADAIERLASLQLGQKKTELAVSTLERVYQINKEDLGDVNAETQTSLLNLAMVCTKTGQHNRGVEYIELSVQMVEQNYSPDDPVVLSTFLTASSLLYEIGFYTRSEELVRRTMILCAESDSYKEGYIASVTQLADIMHAQRKFIESIEYRELALANIINTYGEKSPEYGRNICALALTFDAMGEKDKAQALYEKTVLFF